MANILITNKANKVEEAKVTGLDNWKNFEVYNVIWVRWVIPEKFCNGNPTINARLIARRFEEPNTDAMRNDSPT